MPYRHVVTATADDIDQLDHVSNLVYVRWVLEAACAHSTARGWDWPAYAALGAVFVVRRQEIDYLLPVRRGDEVIVETYVEAWKQASCVRRTTLVRGSDVVARAATTWAFVAWRGARPQRIPDDLRAAFAEPEGAPSRDSSGPQPEPSS
jgi:acyl-CoA thioester hydrolase